MEIGVDDVAAELIRGQFSSDRFNAFDDSARAVVETAKRFVDAVATPTSDENLDLICPPLRVRARRSQSQAGLMKCQQVFDDRVGQSSHRIASHELLCDEQPAVQLNNILLGHRPVGFSSKMLCEVGSFDSAPDVAWI